MSSMHPNSDSGTSGSSSTSSSPSPEEIATLDTVDYEEDTVDYEDLWLQMVQGKTKEVKEAPVKENPFKRNPKGKTKTLEQQIQEVDNVDYEDLWWKMVTGEIKETPVERKEIKKTPRRKTKTLEQELQEEDNVDYEALWWKMVIGEISEVGETPVRKKSIWKTLTRKSKTLEQELREEDKVDYESLRGKMVHDKINVVQETPIAETPTGETQTQKEDNVDYEALSLQMMQAEINEKCYSSPPSLFHDLDLQSLQEGKPSKEGGPEENKVHQTLSPSGFDFQHLKVLRDFPLSSFYGVDFDNLQLQPSSQNYSFYGLDMDSLAAENAALDEFYAKRECKKAVCEKDQSSGNQCSEDQGQDMFLFPESKSEEDDDIMTLKNLFSYKLQDGNLPYVVDKPVTKLGRNHPLLVYINSNIQKEGCVSESRLTDKVLKLQTKYKKLVAEKGKNPKALEFSTPDDYSFFLLSRMTWDQVEESDVHPGGNVQSEANV